MTAAESPPGLAMTAAESHCEPPLAATQSSGSLREAALCYNRTSDRGTDGSTPPPVPVHLVHGTSSPEDHSLLRRARPRRGGSACHRPQPRGRVHYETVRGGGGGGQEGAGRGHLEHRSEEHTSELQSLAY